MKLSLTFPGITGQITPPAGVPTGGLSTSGVNIIGVLVTMFFLISLLYAAWILVVGGFNWIMSQGDKQKLQKTHSQILYAILGIVIMLLAFFVVNVIGHIAGVNLILGPFGP